MILTYTARVILMPDVLSVAKNIVARILDTTLKLNIVYALRLTIVKGKNQMIDEKVYLKKYFRRNALLGVMMKKNYSLIDLAKELTLDNTEEFKETLEQLNRIALGDDIPSMAFLKKICSVLRCQIDKVIFKERENLIKVIRKKTG